MAMILNLQKCLISKEIYWSQNTIRLAFKNKDKLKKMIKTN